MEFGYAKVYSLGKRKRKKERENYVLYAFYLTGTVPYFTSIESIVTTQLVVVGS